MKIGKTGATLIGIGIGVVGTTIFYRYIVEYAKKHGVISVSPGPALR